MDETMASTEGLEQTSDAFLDGWDDSSTTASAADQPESDGAEQTEAAGAEENGGESGETAGQETGAQQQDSGEGAALEPQDRGGQEPAAETPRMWTLRHLDRERTVGEEELIALAQQGMDYDRIRAKYDELKPVADLFNQFATKAGMSTKDYIAHLRTMAHKAAGMNDAEAKRTVELEDREAAVAAREQQEAAKEAADKSRIDADARRRADIAEFQKAFPDAAKEPDKIPQEVWADVRRGMSLVTAYAKYAVKQADERAKAASVEAAAQQQNSRNADRATGSMKSAGGEKKAKDPFLEGWNS